MKITKHKRGYTIQLMDPEFALLSEMVAFGQEAYTKVPKPPLKIYHLLLPGRMGSPQCMAVDHDKRDA